MTQLNRQKRNNLVATQKWDEFASIQPQYLLKYPNFKRVFKSVLQEEFMSICWRRRLHTSTWTCGCTDNWTTECLFIFDTENPK
jgi:hypothetical protein